MSDIIDQVTLDYAQYLASLPSDEARKRIENQKRQIVMAQLPDEEVGKPPIQSLGAYLDADIELPPILVEPGLVARGAITSMTARGGKGKTTLSLNRLVRWAMGRPAFDDLPDLMKPIGPLKVLMIENEGSPGHFQWVLKTILHSNGFDADEIETARDNIYVWGNGGWSGLKLDDPENLALVRRACEVCDPDILFVEPFRGLWKGDENSSTDMSNVLDSLSGIANDFECGVLLTHHERKSGADGGDPMGAARGSGVLEGHAAVMERWVPSGSDQRELSWIKARFQEAPAPIRLEFERDRWGYRLIAEDENHRRTVSVLRNLAVDDYITISEVAEELNEEYGKVRRWLNKVVDEGHAKKKSIDKQVRFRYKGADDNGDEEGLAIT